MIIRVEHCPKCRIGDELVTGMRLIENLKADGEIIGDFIVVDIECSLCDYNVTRPVERVEIKMDY